MRNKKTYIILAALALMVPMEARAMCASEEEMAAFNARVLQSDLMVAALTCGEQGRYNSFVNRFEGELVENGEHLREYFSRSYPQSAEREMNSFVTALANKSSRAVMGKERKDYCAHSKKLFDSTLSISRGQLETVATHLNLGSRHGMKPCGLMARVQSWFSN